MIPSHLDEEAIFHAARAIGDPEARAVYLAGACGGEPALQRRIARLLRVCEEEAGFLAEPVGSATLGRPAAGEGLGGDIGPYRLVETIGEGGMGVVYMADQSRPVRRRVALKVIKPGMDSRQVIARFEVERQALAMMDHPNIARVFDAGATAQGRPYFAMELVHGPPITAYCDRERLSIPERLELFVLVCRAVQHAHQKGVIHRDIKPSNILVTLHDGVATPKVIDFGIAKAVGQNLTDKTAYTGAAQVVGTPMYMSPEQAGLSGVDVDTRSDVYSLGVLLYELLTGATPFDAETFREAAFDELRRLVREEDPPRPSTRLGSLGETITSVSADRRTEARGLDRALRGDLDWIVMKAMEKDRGRRYQTANDFAADVMRYLTDQPVEACPPSRSYRFTKFARRNRATLISTALVALALVAGTVGSAWQALRATRAEGKALEHQRRSERHFYAFNLRQVQEIIEQGQVERAQQRLASLRAELGERKTSDFGWRCLHQLATREVETFVKHQAEVRAIRLSPDGRLLASGDERGVIRLTDLESGRVLNTIDGKSGRVWYLSFSPDGRHLVADVVHVRSSKPCETVIWEVSSGNRVGSIGPYDALKIVPSRFSSSGRRLVLASQASEEGPFTARLYDFEPLPARPILLNELQSRPLFNFNFDHTTVASMPYDGPFTAFDTETFQRRWTGPSSNTDVGYSWPVLSEDGRRVAIDNARDIVILDAATGREERRVQRGDGRRGFLRYSLSRDGGMLLGEFEVLRFSVIDLKDKRPRPRCEILVENPERYFKAQACFSPDASQVVVTPLDLKDDPGPVTLWETAAGRHLATYPGQMRVVSQVFAPDGESLFLNGENAVQRWWFGRRPNEAPERLGGHRDEAWALAFSPDGRVLATGSDDTESDDTIKLWDPATGRLLRSWRADPGTVAALAFSPDGRTLASANLDPSKNLRLWDVESGLLRATLTGHTDKVRSVAFSPDGRTLASAGVDRTVRLWDVATGRLLVTLAGHDNVVRKVVFSPDGRTLASASNDRTVRLWNVAAGKEERSFHGVEKYAAVSFAPDGSTVAAADEGGDIAIWDAATGDRQHVIHGESSRLLALAYSPDGQTLAAAGTGRLIRVWDVLTGQELLTLRGHAAQINELAFSPDSHTLASCSHDGEVRLWRSEPRLSGSAEPSAGRP